MWQKVFALSLFVAVTVFLVRTAAGCDDGGHTAAEPLRGDIPFERPQDRAAAPPPPMPQNPARESHRPPVVPAAADAKNAAKPANAPRPHDPLPPDADLQKALKAADANKAAAEDPAFFSASKAAPLPLLRVDKPKPPPAAPQQAQQAPQAP